MSQLALSWHRMKLVEKTFQVRDYDLAATLTSGQAFRWQPHGDRWVGVIDGRWVELQSSADGITAHTTSAEKDWDWLAHYLQVDANLNAILAGFPDDDAMRSCRRCACRAKPFACCARTRGSASRLSSFPPPNKSFRSSKSLRCFANVSASRFVCRRDINPPMAFRSQDNWRV